MPSLVSTLAPLLIAAGLVGAWAQSPAQSITKNGPVQPLAALAWAQTNCNSMLTARNGTPRVHAEDLMRVASMYDTERHKHGEAAACRLAIMAAAPATEDRAATANVLLIAVSVAAIK